MSQIDWRSLIGGLGRAAERALPVNMGLFVGTMTGNRAPVTEKNFDPATLDALRAAAANAIAIRNERAEGARQVLEHSIKAARSGEWLGSTFEGNTRHDVTPQEYVARAQADYRRETAPASIQYTDYSEDQPPLNDEGWLQGIRSSFNNPEWRAITSVGRAGLTTDARGNTIVVDSYDWNHRKSMEQLFRDRPVEAAGSVLLSLFNPTTAGNVLGTLLAPAEEKSRRPVRINLGLVQPKMRQ